jgi:hypothetical protein
MRGGAGPEHWCQWIINELAEGGNNFFYDGDYSSSFQLGQIL